MDSFSALSLRERLKDWQDFDVAAHYLALAMGIFPLDASLNDRKFVYWTSNALGETLDLMLKQLVTVGVLEERDNMQFRWSPSFIDPVYTSPPYSEKETEGKSEK